MRTYEQLYIAKPDVTDEQVDALNGQLETVIKQGGGKIDKTDKWGVRKLAYRVKKQAEGYYVLIFFHAEAPIVKEIERRLRVSDLVMKFLTVRMDEKLKWLEKRQKARAKRAARKPAIPPPQMMTPNAPAPGAPALPAEPASPVPGAPGVAAPIHAAPALPVEAVAAPPAVEAAAAVVAAPTETKE